MASTGSIAKTPTQAQPLRFDVGTRVSDKHQLRGSGVSRQEEFEIPGYIKELGAVVVETVHIDGESACVFARPQFEAFMRRAIERRRRGLTDAVMFGSVDRLSRSVLDGCAILKEALQADLPIYFAEERLCSKSENDISAIAQKLQAATDYAQKLSKRSAYARQKRAEDGKLPIAQVPWHVHYDKASGRPDQTIAHRAAIVRHMAEAIIEGNSLNKLSRMLAAEGEMPPNFERTGNPIWSRTSLRAILRNRALLGEFWAFGRQMVRPSFFEKAKETKGSARLVYQNKDLAVLSDAEFEAVAAALDRNKAESPRNLKHDYGPLRGRVRCAACDLGMLRDCHVITGSFCGRL